MADDASCLFELFDTSLLAHMSAAYPHSQSLWQLFHLPSDLLSCVISTLRRKPCEKELHKVFSSRGSTSNGATSAPPSGSILLSKIHLSLASRSCKSKGTIFITPSTPSANWTDLGRCLFLMHGGPLWRPTSSMASQTLGRPPTPTPTTDWTCGSPVTLKPIGLRTLRSDGKDPPPRHRSLHLVRRQLSLQPEDLTHR